MSIGMTVNTG